MKFKQLSAIVLACLLVVGILSTATSATTRDMDAATILHELGLLQGVGTLENGNTDFDLNRAPSRQEAITMLVRLLGKETAAQNGNYAMPFSDVDAWAVPYVSYAYENGLTLGISATEFGGDDLATTTQYLTFVLRALGYSSSEDFAWDKAWELTDTLGITYGEYNANSATFLRADLALISASSLTAKLKNNNLTLLEFLESEDAIADTDMVLMDLSVISCEEDQMAFAFFPVPGSPNTYESFNIENVTVNGLDCSVKQYKTAIKAINALPNIEIIAPDSFAYCVLSYDEADAKKHAEQSIEVNGESHPVLNFTFEATGTLKDGTTVNEHFSEPLYIYGYGSLD